MCLWRIQRICPFDERQTINDLGQSIQSECDLTQTTMDKWTKLKDGMYPSDKRQWINIAMKHLHKCLIYRKLMFYQVRGMRSIARNCSKFPQRGELAMAARVTRETRVHGVHSIANYTLDRRFLGFEHRRAQTCLWSLARNALDHTARVPLLSFHLLIAFRM